MNPDRADKLTALREDRMRLLVAVLEKVEREGLDFNMSVWECGTSACAAGWLIRTDQARTQGLLMGGGPFLLDERGRVDVVGYGALSKFLGLGKEDTYSLFDPYFYSELPLAPTTRDVLDRVLNVMKSQGLSLDFARPTVVFGDDANE